MEAPPHLDPVPVALEITIRVLADGRVTLHGPLQDPVAFLGGIEYGKEAYARVRAGQARLHAGTPPEAPKIVTQ